MLALALGGLGMLAPSGWAGEPRPWQLGMQAPATPVQAQINDFHNLLLIIITLITLFVLGLLLYVIVRFDARRHPVPTRTSHNAVIEILWTVVPVVILVIIAIPSFRLMYYMDRIADADMTINVTGNQWFWTYSYPDHDELTFNSNMLRAEELQPGQRRLLEVDNPLVLPVDTNIRVLVTGSDVMHSWFIPAFGVQQYAIAGRTNETWIRVDREGTYYGECNQICGVNHAFMPIQVVAVSKPEFETWLGEARQRFGAAAPADDSPAPAAQSAIQAATPAAQVTADAAPAEPIPAGN
jgi:cytochrome c oxidase subunit II